MKRSEKQFSIVFSRNGGLHTWVVYASELYHKVDDLQYREDRKADEIICIIDLETGELSHQEAGFEQISDEEII